MVQSKLSAVKDEAPVTALKPQGELERLRSLVAMLRLELKASEYRRLALQQYVLENLE